MQTERFAWLPKDDELLIARWNTPGTFKMQVLRYFPGRTENSIKGRAAQLKLGPRISAGEAIKRDIQQAVIEKGPMTNLELSEYFNFPHHTLRQITRRMARDGELVECEKVFNKEHGGAKSIRYGMGEKVTDNPKPQTRVRGVNGYTAYQKTVKAEKSQPLNIEHHYLTRALFGIGEPA
ncbi:MAG: hypothetical protein KGI54_16305 [Pseudomonadota bacterium]|nr:hypothetical protein [Pseudomonadota bacterium]